MFVKLSSEERVEMARAILEHDGIDNMSIARKVRELKNARVQGRRIREHGEEVKVLERRTGKLCRAG